eukprot:scaffold2880_cov103-Cylindrotheca_fusiformis.AAC.2
MSQWMTSGRSRLKARQKNTFAQRAQQRAGLVAAATNATTNTAAVVVAHPQRRRQGHPRGQETEESIAVYQQERAKRQRHANMEISSGEQARQRILPSDIVRHPGVYPPMEAANGGYPPQQQQQQEAPYRIRPSRPIRNPYAAHYYYASQQRQQPQQQQYGDYSHQV